MDSGRRWGPIVARAVVIACALAAALAPAASANTVLHVDAAGGTDAGNCQSSPCKTLGFAITQGRTVPDLITIQAAAGTYTEDLSLGAADSGLTITGAGSGTNPATSTIITGANPAATMSATDSLSLNHLRIVNPPADTHPAIVTGSEAGLALNDVAVDEQGSAGAVAAGGDTTIAAGSVTLENAGAGAAISESGALTVSATPISTNSAGSAAITDSSGPVSLASSPVTLTNVANTSPALSITGRGSALTNVTISGAWSGPAVSDTGALAIVDSSITSGPAPSAPLLDVTDGSGSGLGSDVSIVRTTVHEQSTTQAALRTSNNNMAIDSSELLGGAVAVKFQVSSGVSRELTLASSTIDAGVLGTRDATPIDSVVASTDNAAGSAALVNVEGSILIEPPAATRTGAPATAIVNCADTEVPSTTQAATATLGTINCGAATNGNTSTAALGSIFANPATGYALNPSWNGIDSVPQSAISLPAPFTDSATDLVGNPRVVNGIGTCQPGTRDKGAIELTGHSGVAPAPAIRIPTTIAPATPATFTGSAPNVPAGVTVAFSWHTSDGGSGVGSRFTHTFARPGSYTVSVTANGAAGCTGSKSSSVSVHGLDLITLMKVSPRSFRSASSGGSITNTGKPRNGATVSYQGTESATTAFTVQLVKTGRVRGGACRLVSGRHPKGKRCTLFLSVGAFSHTDVAGAVRFHFTGRLLGRKLPPASYRLRAVPSDAVGQGPAAYASFTIKS